MTAAPAARRPTPALRRRAACLVYEATLLFGLSLVPAVLGTLLLPPIAPSGTLHGGVLLRLFAYLLFGIYFVWSWSARGQTLAMQTWRIRVERADGRPLGPRLAVARYLAASIGWFAPATAASAMLGVARWPSLGLHALGVVGWALLSFAERDRQFWHDRLCGTRLVDVRDEPPRVRPRPR